MISFGELREAKEAVRFCSLEQARQIMVTLLAFHEALIFSPTTSHLERVEGVWINGEAIQINGPSKQSDN